MTVRKRMILLTAILVVGLAGQQAILGQVQRDARNRPSGLSRPLASIPKSLDRWSGRDEPANPDVLEMMNLDDHLQRVYSHPSGDEVVLWISHSKTSRDAYHYPSVCMQGAGWNEDESARQIQSVSIGTSSEPNIPQLRMRFTKSDQGEQYVYYWYYLIGESSIDQAMRALSQHARLFLRGRTNAGVTVEIFSRSPTVHLSRMDEFARLVADELVELIPEGSHPACTLGANF